VAGGGFITVAVLLLLLPFAVLADLFRLFKWLEGPPRPPRPPRTPEQLHIIWACLSAGLLTACAYVPFITMRLIGKDAGALFSEFLRAPFDPPAALAVWAGAIVLGTVYLVIGLHGAADGPHARSWAFWSAVFPVITWLVLWRQAPWLLRDPLVCGGGLVLTIVCLMRCYIAVRGDTAQRAVLRNIRRKSAPLRPARRRRWLLF
jgi:hypothetical protein